MSDPIQNVTITCVHVKDGTPAETVMSQPNADIRCYPEGGGPAVGVVTEVRLCRRCAKRGNPKTMFVGPVAVTLTMPEPYIAREAKTDGEIIGGPWLREEDAAVELWAKWPTLRCTPKTMKGEGRDRPALLIWPDPGQSMPTVMVLGPGFRRAVWDRKVRS